MRRRSFLLGLAGLPTLPILHVGAETALVSAGESQDFILASDDHISRFNRNENPAGISSQCREQLKALAGVNFNYDFHHKAVDDLKSAIAQLHHLSDAEVNVFPGSLEGLRQILESQKKFRKQFWYSSHEYERTTIAAKTMSYKMKVIPLAKNLGVNLAAIEHIKEGVVYFSNPHLPFGGFYQPAEISSLMERVSKKTLVILDECYIQYASPNWEPLSAASLVRQFSNLVVVRTFSKIYGMSGLRLGYALADSWLSTSLSDRQSDDAKKISGLSARLGVTSLTSKQHCLDAISRNERLKALCLSFCRENNIESVPTNGNYFCFFFKDKRLVKSVVESMRPSVIHSSEVFGKSYIKISLRSEADLVMLFAKMKAQI